MPTLLDVVGMNRNLAIANGFENVQLAYSMMQGVSLRPALSRPNTSIKQYAVSQYLRDFDGESTVYMGYAIRTSRYRFVRWSVYSSRSVAGRPVAEELYDLLLDYDETANAV